MKTFIPQIYQDHCRFFLVLEHWSGSLLRGHEKMDEFGHPEWTPVDGTIGVWCNHTVTSVPSASSLPSNLCMFLMNRTDEASAVMQELHWTVVVKKQRSQRTELPIYQ